MPTIETRIEEKRGCGYRKPGGMYFVAAGRAAVCHKLPMKLTVCPCCNQGIKFSRGFSWINSDLFADQPCKQWERLEQEEAFCEKMIDCTTCPVNFRNTKLGLMWVGEKFYKSPRDFTRESIGRGISKRIANIPIDFKIGETWIVLAHRKAYPERLEGGKFELVPGVFSAFCPEKIEYVVTGNESPEKLEALQKRGLTLVKIIKDSEAQLSIV